MRVVTYFGTFKVSEKEAETIATSNSEIVSIEGNFIKSREIKAILQESKYQDYLLEHRKWECKYGKIHPDDECQCQYNREINQ